MIGPIVVLGVATFLLKGAGALVHRVPPVIERRLAGLAPALLAALVVVELGNDDGLPEASPKTAGVAVALLLAALRLPFAVSVIAAALVAAGLRLL